MRCSPKKRKRKKKKNFSTSLSILSDIDAPRNDKGKRHPLPSILALLMIGFLCGLKGYTSIAKWARHQKKLGWTHKKTPCAATFHNILKRVNVDEIEKALTKRIRQYVESCADLARIFDEAAIDGKTMCASKKEGKVITADALLTQKTFCHEVIERGRLCASCQKELRLSEAGLCHKSVAFGKGRQKL